RNGAEERAAITEWLLGLCRELSCAGMTLTNARGEAVFTHGRTFSGASHFQELTQRVLDAGDVTLTDLHIDPGVPPHFRLLVPLRLKPGAPEFGAMLVALDPTDYLYPLLQQWPVPSKTGESMIVRREGNVVVYLSPLRKRPDQAGWLRVPLSNLPSADLREASAGQRVVEGRD